MEECSRPGNAKAAKKRKVSSDKDSKDTPEDSSEQQQPGVKEEAPAPEEMGQSCDYMKNCVSHSQQKENSCPKFPNVFQLCFRKGTKSGQSRLKSLAIKGSSKRGRL